MGKIEPLVIIGGGVIGLAVTWEAARHGLPCIILDAVGVKREVISDLGEHISPFIRVGSAVEVLGIFNGREILWSQGENCGTFRADQIVLATGATDRLMPFPGWTLPGVMSHRETLSRYYYATSRSAVAVKRAVVAGSGYRLAVCAKALVDSGVEVVAIVDVGSTARQFYVHDSALANVPCLEDHALFEVHGKETVTGVTFGPIDPKTLSPIPGPTRTENVDLVAVAFGEAPRHELAVLARLPTAL